MDSGAGPGGTREIQYVSALLSNPSCKGVLPKARMIRPIGVTVTKNNNPITNGLTILCSRSPNRNHSLFSGASSRGIVRAVPRKKAAMTSAQTRNCPSWSDMVKSGHTATTIKTTANTSPKDRSDPALTSSCPARFSWNVGLSVTCFSFSGSVFTIPSAGGKG